MTWADLQGRDARLSPSALETARFGLPVSRLTVGWDVQPDRAELVRDTCAVVEDVLRRDGSDVVVVRYPSQTLALSAAVARSGRVTLPAGCLTYWAAGAGDVRPPAERDGVAVRSARDLVPDAAERTQLVRSIVGDAFDAYGNHYAANPLLDPGAAHEGYLEWASATADADPDNVLILLSEGRPVGVATLTHASTPDRHVEVLLAGLARSVQGRGLYAYLLGAVADLASTNAESVVISTQAHNIRVQRAWARMGLRPVAAVETVHAVRQGLV